MINKIMDINLILKEVTLGAIPYIKHDGAVGQIEQIFRKNGFYTTREYSITK
jgi:hypothetical protein